MKVLLYTRPWIEPFHRKVVNKAFGCVDPLVVSENKKINGLWVGEYIYDTQYDTGHELDEATLRDIVCRDRFLRKCDTERSARIVTRCWNGCYTLFEQNAFDLVFSYPIDAYIADILVRIAKRFKVPNICYVRSFIDDHIIFTNYGERLPLGRDVPEVEVENVYSSLCKDEFLPVSELSKISRKPTYACKFYLRRKAIESVLNPIRRFISGDPDNQVTGTLLVSGRRLADFYSTKLNTIFQKIADLNSERLQTSVYFPLHYIPEASTSYWLNRISPVGYHSFIEDVLSHSSSNITILVKEHPSMYGRRPLEFYEMVRSFDNAVLIHPHERSNYVLSKVETIMTENGSAGVEALLRNKRVVALENNYYSDLHPNVNVFDYLSEEASTFKIDKHYDNKLFIKSLLSDLYPTSYHDWRDKTPEMVEEVSAACKMRYEWIRSHGA